MGVDTKDSVDLPYPTPVHLYFCRLIRPPPADRFLSTLSSQFGGAAAPAVPTNMQDLFTKSSGKEGYTPREVHRADYTHLILRSTCTCTTAERAGQK